MPEVGERIFVHWPGEKNAVEGTRLRADKFRLTWYPRRSQWAATFPVKLSFSPVEEDAAEATRLRAEKKKKDADAAALRAQERQGRPAKREWCVRFS
jgi:hypothetical protein